MTKPAKTIAYCHACGAPMDVSVVAPFSNVECPKCGKHTRVKREFGPYTLLRRHAVGGMSMVFVALDNTLGREVALKILSEEFSADERRIAAFEEEARITASFSHPHVVRVLTTGRAFGRFYIAMELVPGGHFEHQIRERGKIPEVEMLPLAIEVADGLKAAHAAGLIHRDVKPGNILLDAEGHAKLVDFGLALVTHGGKAQATEFWATPYYVPPETVEGHPEDFRSDMYAFGATLYHALAGKPSCCEEAMGTDALREAKKKVVPMGDLEPSVSEKTCRIVDRAMAYDPNDRFSSYDEMISELEVALADLKSGRSEATGSATKRRAEQKRRDRMLLLAGVCVFVALAGGIAWWATHKAPEKTVEILPPVETVPPPVVADTSTDIAKSYREARAAVDAREFDKAAKEFVALHQNPVVQEPTRTWAGVEAVLAAFLDGRSPDARKQAQETAAHARSLPQGSPRLGDELIGTLEKLGKLEPISISNAQASAGDASRVITAMLAGLKNWEQGMLDPAAVCFNAAVSIKLPPDDAWVTIYQKLAADYLGDHQVLTGPLFSKLPEDKAGCEAAIESLNAELVKLKTRGRARFNVRAWQLDLARQAKLPKAVPPPMPVRTVVPETRPPELAEVLAKLSGFARDYQFKDAAAYLKPLPEDLKGANRDSLLTIAESAAVFLADIENDLGRSPVSSDFQLKSGEGVRKLAIPSAGVLTATFSNGQTRSCEWKEFPSDTLIALHRILVKNPMTEAERLRRHECAIAFEWLAGNRERAHTAAAALSQANPAFKQRWESLVAGLPK